MAEGPHGGAAGLCSTAQPCGSSSSSSGRLDSVPAERGLVLDLLKRPPILSLLPRVTRKRSPMLTRCRCKKWGPDALNELHL